MSELNDRPLGLVETLKMIDRILEDPRDLDQSEIEDASALAHHLRMRLANLIDDLDSHSKYVAHCKKSKITLHKKAPQN